MRVAELIIASCILAVSGAGVAFAQFVDPLRALEESRRERLELAGPDQPRPILDQACCRESHVLSYVSRELVMASYRGKITTTGRSEAIRFDKALFKSLPAFRQRAGVRAHVLGPHTLLVTLDEPAAEAPPEAERDPVMSAFLDFLERDMIENPQTLTPFTEADVPRIRELVEGVEVRDEEVLSDEFSF
jgi:antitoxin PrlF